jgi:Carboxylesterase family
LNTQYQNFATQAGCPSGSLTCLKGLSTAVLEQANAIQIAAAPHGEFQYGPAIDGFYVQDLPGKELLAGRFFKNIDLMLGHNRFILLSPTNF